MQMSPRVTFSGLPSARLQSGNLHTQYAADVWIRRWQNRQLSLLRARPVPSKQEFILAARVSGKSDLRISAEHIFPNIANLLIVQGTIQFSLGILAEAGLSYVGLGTQPPIPSWGRMLADAQTMVSFAPHLAIIPGTAIIITVLGLNLLGDGLRDLLDPRVRKSRE